jgi:ribose transport system substrate-binding protein
MDKMDQHWVAVDSGAKTMAKALGLNYKWDAPDVKDNAKQIEAVNNAVADNADLILLAANDPNAISSAVKNAKAKGVKIIYVDSPANEPAIATLSTNNTQAGALAGETMIAELKASGKTSGKIGIIGVNTATNSTMSRENGFRAVIEAAGFTILTTEYKDGDAAASQEAATGFITGNSDLVGLYGTNEGSTVGVGNAIKASSKGVIGVGFDKSSAIQSLLDDGSLKAAMAQNPFTMGYLGVAQAYAALNDASTGPAVIDTGVAVLR